MTLRFCLTCIVIGLAMSGCVAEGGFVADLRHPSAAKRVAAAEFLGAQREADSIPDLVPCLGDSVPEVRAKVAWALGMIRAREARENLINLLSDTDRRVRQAAIWSLTQLEEPESLPALEAALLVEQDVWVKADLRQAVEYLRQFEGDEDVHESGFR